VTLITKGDLLPTHNEAVRRRVEIIFRERNIRALTGDPVVRAGPGRLITENGSEVEFDEALWVTEAAGAPWLADTGLPLDERGFALVEETLRSPADAAVFAAGDIATMPTHPREKSGVYAV